MEIFNSNDNVIACAEVKWNQKHPKKLDRIKVKLLLQQVNSGENMCACMHACVYACRGGWGANDICYFGDILLKGKF